jgi:hypothetical protein
METSVQNFTSFKVTQVVLMMVDSNIFTCCMMKDDVLHIYYFFLNCMLK